MVRYLFDNYVASRFLGTRSNDPMVAKFMKSIKEILNDVISKFLVDYSIVKDIELDAVFDAYREFYRLYVGQFDSDSMIESDSPKNPKTYDVLLDSYFYEELELRINQYYGKLYEKYVSEMTEKAKLELDEYIKQKNVEKNTVIDERLKQIDESIKDLEEMGEIIENHMKQFDNVPNKLPTYAEFIEEEKKRGGKSLDVVIKEQYPELYSENGIEDNIPTSQPTEENPKADLGVVQTPARKQDVNIDLVDPVLE